MLERSSSESTIHSVRHGPTKVYHIVFLHRKLKRRPEDRYMVDLAVALKNSGHKVTIFTSELDQKDCLEEVNPLFGDLAVFYSGWWLPRGFWFLKAVIMAIRLIFLPPTPKPNVIILDTDTIVLYILAKFTRYKTIFLNHFFDLKYLNYFSDKMKVTRDLMTTKTIGFANEVIVLNKSFGEVFKLSFPKVQKDLNYLCPSVDSKLWRQGRIDISRIVPDLPKRPLLFVVFGQYCKRSNFELAIRSFENLLLLLDSDLKERLHLVVGGNCKNSLDQISYYTDIKTNTKDKFYASQVTFLKQTPIMHKKTLIEECIGVIHPTLHDMFPETILAAMRLGRPIIASNTGFAKEVLTHRISGILIEPDSHTFASAMYKIVANPTVQMFISDMARDIYKRQYSFDCFSYRINDIVSKCVEKRDKEKLL